MNFDKLDSFLSRQGEMGIPGCEIHIHYEGKTVFRKTYGFADTEKKQPTNNKTAYLLKSMSKLFTTGAAMRLWEAGKLGLDDPVAEYLPAYQNLTVKVGEEIVPAKNTLLVRHLMAMQGGFDYDLCVPVVMDQLKEYNGHATTRQIIDALSKKPLCFEPGTHFQYSLCHDILGALIESISGIRLSDYMRQSIFDPLGITENIAYNRSRLPHPERLAQAWIYDDNTHTSKPIPHEIPISDEYESGGGGMIATNDAYMAYAATIAEGGLAPDGKTRLFKPETIERWRQNEQTTPTLQADFNRIKIGYGYGLGVRTNAPHKITHIPPTEFGWDGATGGYVMLDAKNHIAVVYNQNVFDCCYAFDTIHMAIRDMTYEALGF